MGQIFVYIPSSIPQVHESILHGSPSVHGSILHGSPLPVLAKESQIHLSFPQSNESPQSNIKIKKTNMNKIKIQTTTDQSACMKKIHYRRAKMAAPALALEVIILK